MSNKQMKLRGTLLGIDFDITISGDMTAPNQVSGTAGGHPVDLKIIDNEDDAAITGTLLGKPLLDIVLSQ